MAWDLVNLGDLTAELTSGSRPKGGAVDSGIPSLGAEHLDGQGGFKFSKTKFVPTEFFDEMSKGKIRRDDILIVKDGATTGKVSHVFDGFPFEKAAINEHVFQLKTDEKRLFPRFCFHFLNSEKGQKAILSDFRGSTIGGISRGFIDKIQIPLPPLPDQQKIAARLDRADALRRLDAVLLKEFDALAESVFLEMFGDLEKFETSNLSDLANLVSGVAKNEKGFQSDFLDVPYMRVANVQDGKIDLKEVKTIKVSKSDFEKYQLKKDDLLLTEGGDADKLGRGAVWQGQIEPCIHQNHIFRVRITSEKVHPTYLSTHLSSAYGKSYFLKAAKQTTGIASINMTQLKNFKVYLPPLAAQKTFAARLEKIEAQKALVRQQSAASGALLEGLLAEAFG